MGFDKDYQTIQNENLLLLSAKWEPNIESIKLMCLSYEFDTNSFLHKDKIPVDIFNIIINDIINDIRDKFFWLEYGIHMIPSNKKQEYEIYINTLAKYAKFFIDKKYPECSNFKLVLKKTFNNMYEIITSRTLSYTFDPEGDELTDVDRKLLRDKNYNYFMTFLAIIIRTEFNYKRDQVYFYGDGSIGISIKNNNLKQKMINLLKTFNINIYEQTKIIKSNMSENNLNQFLRNMRESQLKMIEEFSKFEMYENSIPRVTKIINGIALTVEDGIIPEDLNIRYSKCKFALTDLNKPL